MNQVLREHVFPSGLVLQVVQGDITSEPVEAIVNAANSQLVHGGGLAGVISQRGGPAIQAESTAWVRKHGPVSHAEPAYTTAGNLPFRYVIHAVGPIWGTSSGGPEEEDNKLAAAVTGSLRLAEELGLKSLALPAISTGIFGFPKRRAAQVILVAINAYQAERTGGTLHLVRLTLFDQPTLNAFLEAFDDHFGQES